MRLDSERPEFSRESFGAFPFCLEFLCNLVAFLCNLVAFLCNLVAFLCNLVAFKQAHRMSRTAGPPGR